MGRKESVQGFYIQVLFKNNEKGERDGQRGENQKSGSPNRMGFPTSCGRLMG